MSKFGYFYFEPQIKVIRSNRRGAWVVARVDSKDEWAEQEVFVRKGDTLTLEIQQNLI